MRVFVAIIVLMLLIIPVGVRAFAEPSGETRGDLGLIPGVYCYDYYFLGNKGFDITFFPKTNLNATFMDPEDISHYKGQEECSTYVVSEKADVNLFDPFFSGSKVVDYSTDRAKILPNPGVMLIDEENIGFKQFSSRDTVLYGGVLPFVALPDADLETEDSFFNEESFSLFLYFKTKF